MLVVSFSGRTCVHPPHPQGIDLPCGRESLGCHKEPPHGHPSHPCTDANACRRSCAVQRPFVQVQHLRRRAQGFDVRRRFDGQRADTPEEHTEFTADGKPYTVQRFVLGSAPAKLPIPEPRCPELQALIQQMEELPAPDGFRRITHLLVDAGARDFTWIDPLPKDIIATPPTIAFTVVTAKFQGRVAVQYKRGLDLYAVELHRDRELVERVDEVFFDALGETLERLIDDGSWRRIRVHCLSGRKSVRH